jgi:excisionase family DNA binding protein
LAEILADLQKWELLYILKEALPGVNKPPIFKGYIFHETKYKNRLETYGALDFDITVHKMLSINQACDLLNISRPTIYKLIGEGKLETVNFFGQKRIQMKTILQLIQDHISK